MNLAKLKLELGNLEHVNCVFAMPKTNQIGVCLKKSVTIFNMGIGSRSTTPSNKTSKTPNLDMEVEEDYDVIELPHPKQVNC